MPIIKSAKKAIRQTKRRTSFNKKIRELTKEIVKKAKKNPTAANLKTAYSGIDNAVKKHILHKNKGARIKSRLAKLVQKKIAPKISPKTKTQKTSKKSGKRTSKE